MKLSLLDQPKRIAALAALAALTTGACVQPAEPGVGIKALSADIVFGADPIVEEEATPAPLQPVATDVEVDEVEALPPQVFEPAATKEFPRPPIQVPRTKPAPVCPDAAVDEFPDITAPQNVPAGVLPKEGLYRWKRSGSITKGGVTTPIEGFEERVIRNVTVAAADPANSARRRFTFEMVQPSGDGLAITRYAVDTAARSAEQNDPVSDLRITAGEPERGVVIDSVTYTDNNQVRDDRPAFIPVTGLLVTPLPIRTGETFQSVSVDPRTQQVWRYDAQLTARDRVDACGEILDGWRTQGTLTISGENGGERSLAMIVSPQFGGIPILESTKYTDGDGAQIETTFTIGQLEPSPFPAAGSA